MKRPGTAPLPGWVPLAVLGALAGLVLLWAWHGRPVPLLRTGTPQSGPVRTEHHPLSPQECVTECQARQTDCIQDCDGRIPCERACVSRGEACVARCRRPASDAGDVWRLRLDGTAVDLPEGFVPPNELPIHTAILRARADGRVVMAGAHEDVIVHRKASGRCELVETTGMWLGISPDISDTTEDVPFQLGSGDTAVLYTDGLIEARDAAGEELGMERVLQLIQAVAEQGPQAIVDALRVTAVGRPDAPVDAGRAAVHAAGAAGPGRGDVRGRPVPRVVRLRRLAVCG